MKRKAPRRIPRRVPRRQSRSWTVTHTGRIIQNRIQ
jgi:hypothetical protein